MRVTVGDDVETGDLLCTQVNRNRVLVLLAVAQVHHRFEKACVPSPVVYQLGRGNDPMIEVGNMTPADALYIVPPLHRAERDRCLSIAAVALISR